MTWGAIGGAAIGLVGSSMSGGKGNAGTQQVTADPWSGVQPALRSLYDASLQNFQSGGPQYYPNSTVAPQGGVTQMAQQGMFGRATQGNPLLGSGQGAADATLNDEYMWGNPSMLMQLGIGSGSMLNANPYVDSMFNQAADQVGQQFSKHIMPGVSSMFAGAGRYGSNAHDEGIRGATTSFSNTLNNLAASIYGGNYANERQLQQQALSDAGTQFGRERVMQSQAMGMSPELSQADYFDIAQLMGLGGQQDAFSQGLLNADISRWDFNQQAPNNNLQTLAGLLQGYPTGKTTTNSVPTNPLMGALGGAATGWDIMRNLGSRSSVSGFSSGGFGAGINPNTGEFMGSLEF